MSKPLLGGGRDSFGTESHGPYFPRQAYLPKTDQALTARAVAKTRHDSEQCRQIGRRLPNSETANYVHKYVFAAQRHATVSLQHGQ